MSRFDTLMLGGEEPFATGASRYLDTCAGVREPHPRIYVKFRPDGVSPSYSFLALLDTGGHFCILNQDVAELVQDHLTDRLSQVELRTAHGLVRGELYSHRVTLIAEKGHHLDLRTTVFVAPAWRAPSFIGYSGALDHLCFAIDSQRNRFYFGLS